MDAQCHGIRGFEETQSSGGTLTLQLHGELVATCADASSPTGVDNYAEQTNMASTAQSTPATATRYGWFGACQRSGESVGGLILMGARLYNPKVGRFLQIDPIAGGSANSYDYANQDPINQMDLDGTKPQPAKLSEEGVSGGECEDR
ncbi:RHS repeat-associated core domain-containing protein [Sphaerisporangium sp. NPDC051011]|uniref:RHS repeat-associated core domain-containing protein n=1 Tax=Sphaerisporangium sp. NPDC051011 TaxID=3155792 RepID=UPI0033E341D5